MMDEQSREIRAVIERSRAGKTHWRCPCSLRSEIAIYAQERRAAGVSWLRIAEALSVSEGSLTRWCRGESPGFREIRVKSDGGSAGALQLVTPRGYRIEGLSVESAAALLSRL